MAISAFFLNVLVITVVIFLVVKPIRKWYLFLVAIFFVFYDWDLLIAYFILLILWRVSLNIPKQEVYILLVYTIAISLIWGLFSLHSAGFYIAKWIPFSIYWLSLIFQSQHWTAKEFRTFSFCIIGVCLVMKIFCLLPFLFFK